MKWMSELGRRLGYSGVIDRRQFAAGAILTVVAPYALSIAIKGVVLRLFETLPRLVALALAIVLTVVVCAAIVAWFWGWTVLLTRRARDVGLPAWAGVGSAILLIAIGKGLGGVTSPWIAGWTGFLAWIVFAVLWCAWPARPSTSHQASSDLAQASATR